jgi:hypothetical protein
MDPGRQLAAGGRRERLLGVGALLRVGLADDHGQRPGQGQAAPDDGRDIQRRPAAGRVAVQADAAGTVGGGGDGGGGRAAHGVKQRLIHTWPGRHVLPGDLETGNPRQREQPATLFKIQRSDGSRTDPSLWRGGRHRGSLGRLSGVVVVTVGRWGAFPAWWSSPWGVGGAIRPKGHSMMPRGR